MKAKDGRTKVMNEERGEETREEGRKVKVTAGTTNKEIVDYDTKGFDLFFDYEDFRELPSKVVDKLSGINVVRYMNEYNLWVRKLKREAHEKKYGKAAGIRVLEPLGRSALDRLKVRGLPKGLHYFWPLAEQVEEYKRYGYTVVDKRFEEVVAGDGETPSGARVIKKPDGNDEHVLMVIPEERYKAHVEAMSERSVGKKKVAHEELQEEVAKISKDVKVKGGMTEEKGKLRG